MRFWATFLVVIREESKHPESVIELTMRGHMGTQYSGPLGPTVSNIGGVKVSCYR